MKKSFQYQGLEGFVEPCDWQVYKHVDDDNPTRALFYRVYDTDMQLVGTYMTMGQVLEVIYGHSEKVLDTK